MKEFFLTLFIVVHRYVSKYSGGLIVSAMKGQKSRLVMAKKKFHFANCTKTFTKAKKIHI